MINDDTTALPYPSKIDVSALRRGRVLDVNVRLNNINHTYLSDLDVLLAGPKVHRAVVMSDVGGGNPGVSDVTLTLDAEATVPLTEDTIPTSGRYRPADDADDDQFPAPAPSEGSKLAVFDGTNPNGTWNLYVVDDSFGDSGEFSGGWSVTIKARVLR